MKSCALIRWDALIVVVNCFPVIDRSDYQFLKNVFSKNSLKFVWNSEFSNSGSRGKINVVFPGDSAKRASPGRRTGFSHVNPRWNPALLLGLPRRLPVLHIDTRPLIRFLYLDRKCHYLKILPHTCICMNQYNPHNPHDRRRGWNYTRWCLNNWTWNLLKKISTKRHSETAYLRQRVIKWCLYREVCHLAQHASSQALHDVYEQIKMLDYTRSNLCYTKINGCMYFDNHHTLL